MACYGSTSPLHTVISVTLRNEVMCPVQISLSTTWTDSNETLRRATRKQENFAHFLRCRRAGSDSAAYTDPGPDVPCSVQPAEPMINAPVLAVRSVHNCMWKGIEKYSVLDRKEIRTCTVWRKQQNKIRRNLNEFKHSEGFRKIFKIKDTNFFSSKIFHLLNSLRTNRNAFCLKDTVRTAQ